MVMFAPGDRSEKIGMRLDSLVVSETWGEVWRATHDQLGRILVVAYKRDPGKNLFLACRNAFAQWKTLGEQGVPGVLKIHKIVASGKIPMVLAEDPGGETVREFFASEAATLKKTARMVRACCRTVRRLQTEGLTPVGLTPDTIFRKEGAEDFPAWMLPVSPGVFGSEVRLGNGRYISPEALLLADPSQSNADVYALAWIWAELLARNHEIDHDEARLGQFVHYPRAKGAIRKALKFKEGRHPDAKRLELEADQWIENDAALDRQDFDRSMAERKEARAERRRKRREQAAASAEVAAEAPASPVPKEGGEEDLFGLGEEEFGGEGFAVGADDEVAGRGAALPSFARDIPPLEEKAPRPAAAAKPAAASASAAPARPAAPGSTLIPTLVTVFFVVLLIGAFGAGAWILMRGGGEAAPEAPAVASAPDAAAEGSAEAVSPATVGPDATASDVPAGVPAPGASVSPAAAPPPAPGASAPASATERPESVEGLVEVFRRANESRDLERIRHLYYDAAEFGAVESILGTLAGQDREMANLQFVPGPETGEPSGGLRGVGTLRVTTTAFNLEIPVGTEGGRFFLTSVGRVGAMWTPAPTPVPTEIPLTFAETAEGLWEADPGGRAARFGLGKAARAEIAVRVPEIPSSPATVFAQLSNPGTAPLYYQFSLAVFDEEGRLVTAGAGGGSIEAGVSDQGQEVQLPVIDAVLGAAARYEAVWYEEEVPPGLVGGAVQKNPRLPVGFARAFGFELGEGGPVKGRIYTDYVNNQKVVAAPGMMENTQGRALDALYAVSLLDAEGRLISGQAQRAAVPARDVFAFDQMLFYLPQAAYARVEGYEAVVYLDGAEFGRSRGELGGGSAGDESPTIGLPAATPTSTPTPTPTPLAGAQATSTPGLPAGTPDAAAAGVDEALASLRAEGPAGAAAGEEVSGEAAPFWDDNAAAGEGYEDYEEYAEYDEGALPEETQGLLRLLRGLGIAGQILGIVFGYFLAAFCFQKILEKAGKGDSIGLAWVPVFNWVLVP